MRAIVSAVSQMYDTVSGSITGSDVVGIPKKAAVAMETVGAIGDARHNVRCPQRLDQ